MATLEIISSNCKEPKCERRATMRVVRGNGQPEGEYCGAHAQSALRRIAKEEGARGRAS